MGFSGRPASNIHPVCGRVFGLQGVAAMHVPARGTAHGRRRLRNAPRLDLPALRVGAADRCYQSLLGAGKLRPLRHWPVGPRRRTPFGTVLAGAFSQWRSLGSGARSSGQGADPAAASTARAVRQGTRARHRRLSQPVPPSAGRAPPTRSQRAAVRRFFCYAQLHDHPAAAPPHTAHAGSSHRLFILVSVPRPPARPSWAHH